MISEITIGIEKQNHGRWLKIFIPYHSENNLALIQNNNGNILRDVKLSTGNNAIDISNIPDSVLHVKIETTTETLLRQVEVSAV